MTIGDYIRERFSLWAVQVPAGLIGVELSKLNLTEAEEMTGEINLDEVFYNLIPDILPMPNSVSEGGYSISHNKDGLTFYYKILARRLKKLDLLATDGIKDISNQW